MKKLTVEDVVINGVNQGVSIMGDDFIGYKFVGENNEFWNNILFELHNNGHDVGKILNSQWLRENNVAYMEHDNTIWNN